LKVQAAAFYAELESTWKEMSGAVERVINKNITDEKIVDQGVEEKITDRPTDQQHQTNPKP
jgi:hypothetical protein